MSKINKIILEEIEEIKNRMRVIVMFDGNEKEFKKLNEKLLTLLYSLNTEDLLSLEIKNEKAA